MPRQLIVALAAGAAVAATGAAAEPSRTWLDARRQLTACLAGPDVGRGACLERAARALDAADARGEGPVPNAEQQQVARRRAFGIRAPAPTPPSPRAERTPDRERPDRLVTTLAAAYQNSEGNWVMRTAEGAAWVQTDGAYLVTPPRAGSSFFVRPGALGSWFCLIDNRREVRCKRRS